MSDLEHIPEGYFEGLHDRLKSSIEDLDDNIAQDAPTLSRLGKERGYSLPDDYKNQQSFSFKVGGSSSNCIAIDSCFYF